MEKNSDLIFQLRINLQIILRMQNFPANIFYKKPENIKVRRAKEIQSKQPGTPE